MKKFIILIAFAVILITSLCIYVSAEQDTDHIHTEKILPEIPATCTESGLTEGKICSECNDILVVQEVIPLLPHNTDIPLVGAPATCTQDGLTDGKICSVCNSISVQQITLPKTGHTSVTIQGISSTCISTGYTEGEKCERCESILVAQTVIPIDITRHYYDGPEDNICNGCGHDQDGTIIESNDRDIPQENGCNSAIYGGSLVVLCAIPALWFVFGKKRKF